MTAHRDPCPSSSLEWGQRSHGWKRVITGTVLTCLVIDSLKATGLGGDAGNPYRKISWFRGTGSFSPLQEAVSTGFSVLVPDCCCNKSSQAQWSKQYKFILLQLWRLKSPMVWQACFPSGSSAGRGEGCLLALSTCQRLPLLGWWPCTIQTSLPPSPLLSRTLLPLFFKDPVITLSPSG